MNFTTPPPDIPLQPIRLQGKKNHAIDVLRLDLLHPVVSGNKWFKLTEWMAIAQQEPCAGILSFGGAYSNHIVALAWAAREAGFPSRALIRGEEPDSLNPTLTDARNYGMELLFIPRQRYRQPEVLLKDPSLRPPGWLVVPEGGKGPEGVNGAARILDLVPARLQYSHICCAVGTGTMLAGIRRSAAAWQEVVGISSLKGADTLTPQILSWLPPNAGSFRIFFDYHFGGYGRHPQALLDYMNRLYLQTGLPTDIIYTSKLVYGVEKLMDSAVIPPGSRVLLIHSGGLQGNRSLLPGQLSF